MTRKYRLISLAIIVIILSACEPVDFFPEDGKWYCAELNMQLDFGETMNCFIMKDNKAMRCACGSDRGSKWLSVSCQEVNCEYCKLGEEVFLASFVSLDDAQLILQDAKQEHTYVFIRIE